MSWLVLIGEVRVLAPQVRRVAPVSWTMPVLALVMYAIAALLFRFGKSSLATASLIAGTVMLVVWFVN